VGQILVVAGPSNRVYKLPGEIRDVTIDWTSDLPAGTSIVDTTFAAADPTLTLGPPTYSGTQTGVRLAGGNPNTSYSVLNSAYLDDGEIHQYPFTVACGSSPGAG